MAIRTFTYGRSDDVTYVILTQVSIMATIRHPNVVMFMGLCLNPVCVVTEFCARGSLSDVIRKAATSKIFAQLLDWPKRLSMVLDAAKVGSWHCQHASR